MALQFAMAARSTPASMAGHIINVTIAVVAFQPSVSGGPLAAWAAASYLVAAYVLYRWTMRSRQHSGARTGSSRSLRRAMLYAAMLGAPWGVLGIWLLGQVSPQQELILVALCLGMSASGSVLLSAIYPAAITYMACVLAPIAFKCLLLGEREYLVLGALTVCYALFLVSCIRACARLFAEKNSAVEELKKSLAQTEIAKQELEGARSAAEAASRAKSSFLAVMSHEIRTPMNAVLGLSSSLLEGALPDEQRKLVQTIHDAGDSLLEILNDILDYSKLDAGELTLETIAFAPKDIVDTAVSIIEPRASAKGYKVTTSLGPCLPQALLGDAGRLRQVLLNLLSNAVKFTSAGGVSITVRCKGCDGTNATVEWAISDTGIGIAPDRLGLLFKDFVQADCSINRRFGGSGLGLSICKRIIEKLGGDINIDSTQGQGTTVRFSVKLPITQLSSVGDAHDGAHAALEAHIVALNRPLRVLIADDNPTNRLVAAKMLESLKVQANMAGDGMEAVAAASRFSYDLILMDVRMPEMDGLVATRTLRDRGITVPVIAFTANAFADDVKGCVSAGMNDFVAKPVRKKVLLEAIARVLQPSGSAAGQHGARAASKDSEPALDPLPAEGDTFDSAAYEALAEELGHEGMQEAVAAFVEEMTTRVRGLRAYSLEQDRGAISREAHTIKGTAATFGLPRLSEMAKWLERHADKVTADEFADVTTRLDAAFAQARAHLPDRPQQGSASLQ